MVRRMSLGKTALRRENSSACGGLVWRLLRLTSARFRSRLLLINFVEKFLFWDIACFALLRLVRGLFRLMLALGYLLALAYFAEVCEENLPGLTSSYFGLPLSNR